MILRKCRTENPAISAAFGMSRNVFFTTVPSVVFMDPSLSARRDARGVPKGKRLIGGGIIAGCCISDLELKQPTMMQPPIGSFVVPLFFRHKRIFVVRRRLHHRT